MPVIRIVKMTFAENNIDAFTRLFNERKKQIRNFEGCHHLELWQDEKDNCIFFTYSIWQSEDQLNHYRFSDFFKETWSLTRALFNAKAEAWTVKQVQQS